MKNFIFCALKSLAQTFSAHSTFLNECISSSKQTFLYPSLYSKQRYSLSSVRSTNFKQVYFSYSDIAFLIPSFQKYAIMKNQKVNYLRLCNIELPGKNVNNQGSDDKSLGNAQKHISRMLERDNLSNILVHTYLHIFIFL